MLINVLSVIIGLVGTIALSGTLSFDLEKTAYTNSTVAFVFFVMAVVILRYVYLHLEWKDKKGAILAAVYSLGLAFALTAGKQLHTVENFDIGNPALWVQMLIIGVFFVGPVWYLLQWFGRGCLNQKAEGNQTDKVIEDGNIIVSESCDTKSGIKRFLLTWLVIFVCWIPVFLALYPGAFVYDATDEYVQVATRQFTTHHPLLHVLMLGGSVCFGNKFLGSYNVGIVLYTVFQMIVLSGVFAYTLSYLKQFISKKWYVAITLVYGLFPIFPMYAVCSAKDTLFTGAFLVMLVQMCKMCEGFADKGTKNTDTRTNKKLPWKTWDIVLFICASACMMLLRNNGVLAYIALFAMIVVVAVIRYKKTKLIASFAVCMLISIVIYKGMDTALIFVLHADDSERQEILTVPIQQLARTHKYSPEVFTEEEKEILFSYIPEDVLVLYDADLADNVKIDFNNVRYSERNLEFWDLWYEVFKKEPIIYLNAWLTTSYGYWYPDTIINVYGGRFQYVDSSYFGFVTEQPGTRASKFAWLEGQYRKMSLEIYQQNVPVISMLFSPGFMFWLFLGCTFIVVYKKNYERILPVLAIFLLWGTVIPGPTFLVRYVLILWFALPIYVQAVMTHRNMC